jgi:hypothetical protein
MKSLAVFGIDVQKQHNRIHIDFRPTSLVRLLDESYKFQSQALRIVEGFHREVCNRLQLLLRTLAPWPSHRHQANPAVSAKENHRPAMMLQVVDLNGSDNPWSCNPAEVLVQYIRRQFYKAVPGPAVWVSNPSSCKAEALDRSSVSYICQIQMGR